MRACLVALQWRQALVLLSEMCEAKVDRNVRSYNLGIGAYRQSGRRWKSALLLLSELSEAKLDPNVYSYSAAISACQDSEQWHQALALLGDLRERKLKPDPWIWYSGWIHACETGKLSGKLWSLALSLLRESQHASEAQRREAYKFAITCLLRRDDVANYQLQRHHLLLWNRRMRERS
ncbi:unnamed protein product [Prorocentrum cordatum]|uniref:Uncharacterized protein n=1 Tax=Prorocentrum cordatum TaxID=2364126 RepID=A0ABN9UIZ8_9DINO|nr:unnamed protein product [Polarella glacialis]